MNKIRKEKEKEPLKKKRRKNQKYEKLLRNYLCVPIAVETFWFLGLNFVKEIVGEKTRKKQEIKFSF